MDLYFTRVDGTPDETVAIAEYTFGDYRALVSMRGTTRDADTMLAGNVAIWSHTGVTFASGIIFDTSRYLVGTSQPLDEHAASALILAGFRNVESFID